MDDDADTVEMDYSSACESCAMRLDGRRYLQADGSTVRSFCSEACLRTALTEQHKRRWRVRRRGLKIAVVGLAVAGACLVPHEVQVSRRASAVRAAATAAPAAPPTVPVVPEGWFGPEWPPTEMSVLATLGRDAWLHPLAGPVRRMPLRDSRVFGAIRPGNRAIECRNGHCGVDLGGEIWGEHVRAVHDGVVDFVQRGANAQHGGQFVRISHRGGMIFTQYFHLAAIPRWMEVGRPVRAGEVVGLVGDTGVKASGPHLHFTISIRPSPDDAERYIDPEPLIALWPLHIPDEGKLSVAEAPGAVRGALSRKGRRRPAHQATVATETAEPAVVEDGAEPPL